MGCFQKTLWALAALWVGSTAWTVWNLFKPPVCSPGTAQRCFKPAPFAEGPFDLHLWIGDSWCRSSRAAKANPQCVWLDRQSHYNWTGISAGDPHKYKINVKLPPHARANGTVCLTAAFVAAGERPREKMGRKLSSRMVRTEVRLTRHVPVRSPQARSLLGENDGDEREAPLGSVLVKESDGFAQNMIDEAVPGEIWTHWKPFVKLRVVSGDFPIVLDRTAYPELLGWPTRGRYWLPLVYADETSLFSSHLRPLSRSPEMPDPPISIEVLPTSLGAHRVLRLMTASFSQLRTTGFSEGDLEELMLLVAPERLFRLLLTLIISVLHTVFSFLAFKNDVGFWSGRETVAGLSRSAVVGNAICSVIILLFLLDSDHTSRLVVGTVATSTVIEVWKVTKMLKFRWRWGALPTIMSETREETRTREFDSQGIKYLSYALLPLILGWSGYCLIHYRYKSWYSWVVSCAANGVYAFGFVLMTPQIFINYRLKSVAHLPWRALMYKSFNTFVDDAFAFIIEMPTAHRIATLRDDLVFFVYLYQRWLYPVDKTRPNEFGIAYEKEKQAIAPPPLQQDPSPQNPSSQDVDQKDSGKIFYGFDEEDSDDNVSEQICEAKSNASTEQAGKTAVLRCYCSSGGAPGSPITTQPGADSFVEATDSTDPAQTVLRRRTVHGHQDAKIAKAPITHRDQNVSKYKTASRSVKAKAD